MSPDGTSFQAAAPADISSIGKAQQKLSPVEKKKPVVEVEGIIRRLLLQDAVKRPVVL